MQNTTTQAPEAAPQETIQGSGNAPLVHRWVQLSLKKTKSSSEVLSIEGITEEGEPIKLFRNVKINNSVEG